MTSDPRNPNLPDPDAMALGQQLLTRLAQAASEWRETFDAMPSVIVLTSPEGGVLRINLFGAQVAGRTPSSCIGLQLSELPAQEPWLSLEALRKRGGSSMQVSSEADGRIWSLAARPLGSPTTGRLLLTAGDVTRERRLEAEVASASRAPELGAFVSSLAQEVRKPLLGVLASLDALERDVASASDALPHIRREVERLSAMMTNLLEYGKPAPKQLLRVPWSEVMSSALGSAGAEAAKKGVRLQVTPAPAGAGVMGDGLELAQVVQNLLSNAVAFAPAGSTVRVRAVVEGGVLRATVDDEGPGFSPEDLERASEPFYTRRKGGTGLGLAIVRRILSDLGGQLFICNGASGGASVSIVLPSR